MLSACVNYSGFLINSGYGRASLSGKRGLAHRVAWERAFGPIPEGMFVLHKCDNKTCVNPEHLFLGTQADNVMDMIQKGRDSRGVKHSLAMVGKHRGYDKRGERNPRHKLTEAQVMEIFLASGTGASIARKYGVSQPMVGYIKRRQSWKHLTAI